jgi:hypothetical protein
LRACSRRAVLAYPFRPDKNATQENIMPLSPRHDDTRPGSTISAKAADTVVFPDSRPDDRVLEEDLTKKMIRRPTEADFADVLSPEGNSGDVVGSDVSDSTMPSDASIGGTR